jgi:Flp pilus assembly pilin Flp
VSPPVVVAFSAGGDSSFTQRLEARMDAVVALMHKLVVLGRDDGQDLIEYGLLVALIAIVAFVAVGNVGAAVNTLFWQTFAGVI